MNNFKKSYEESVNQRRTLENRKELMKTRMKRALVLTMALDTEKVRWTEQYEELKRQSDLIIGISLISAASINYLGAMTQDYRQSLTKDWINFCNNKVRLHILENFELTRNVVKQTMIRNWINKKLPDDQYSIENAIYLKYSIKYPLIIDPQNQAGRWIREMEGPALKVCKSEDPLVFRTLEQAIRLGQPILIENVGEYFDPVLDPVLKKEILVRGAQKIVRLGDVEVEYNDSFRLFLVTNHPNPHYLPAAFIKVNLINFTITFKCLFDQLLSQVVSREKPELERERISLLELISQDSLTLRELEDRSLYILSKSETTQVTKDAAIREEKMLLDDQYLIETLSSSKKTSQNIQERLIKNEETEKNLNVARQKYSAIATRASILFFSVQNLASLNVMYQFSLNWFYNIFQSCLGGVADNSGYSSDYYTVNPLQQQRKFSNKIQAINLEEVIAASKLKPVYRQESKTDTNNTESQHYKVFNSEEEFQEYIDAINMHLTQTVFQVVSWALFARHKLIFSFSLSLNILKHDQNTSDQKITSHGYNFFLNSTLLADMQQETLSAKISKHAGVNVFKELLKVDEKKLRQILLLEEILPEKFASLTSNMEKNYNVLWRKFMSIKDPYQFMSNQENWKNFDFNGLTKFQKLILIKLLRPDALVLSIDHFITETLDANFLSAPIPTLNELYNQSSSIMPIIFILSPGSDPTNQLLRFAKDIRGNTLHLEIVSLGQGQGPRAEELINKSLILKGKWIFLQNCHLAASFMPRLQQIVNKSVKIFFTYKRKYLFC